MNRLIASLVLLLACVSSIAHASARFAEGDYRGDTSLARNISGLGFRPDAVLIVGETNEPAIMTTAGMSTGMAKPLANSLALLPDLIRTLDADGFSVGSSAYVNQPGSNYYWCAFQASPGELGVGSYDGDGADNRDIPTGFEPEYVIVLAENKAVAMQRFATESSGMSIPFGRSGESSDRIQKFTANGFQVGKNDTVNATGVRYHWIAFAKGGPTQTSGSYLGDLSSQRVIRGLPFRPEALMVKGSSSSRGNALRVESMLDPTAAPVEGGPFESNTIIDLESDGFTVGSSPRVNELLRVMHWIAFRDTPSDIDIALSVGADEPMPAAGDTINVTLDAGNLGLTDATGVMIGLTTSPGLTLLQAVPTAGSVDSLLTKWDVGGLGAGGGERLSILAHVEPGTEGKALSLVATVTGRDQLDTEPSNDQVNLNLGVLASAPGVELQLVQTGQSLLPAQARVTLLELRLRNTKLTAVTLQELQLTDASTVAGNGAQLDASWQAFQLALPDNKGTIATAMMSAGSVHFAGLDRVIPADGSLDLVVLGGATFTARDGDILDLTLDRSDGLVFKGGEQVGGANSDDLSGDFPVDGMVAEQVRMNRVDGEGLLSGFTRQLVMDFEVPSNGYAPDILEKLNLIQYGSARASIPGQAREIDRLEAWADDGDGLFDSLGDTNLGQVYFTGARWELTGLAVVVPVPGRRLFISADIGPDAEVGRTVELGVAGPPDPGLGMLSTNDGPIDEAPEAAQPRSIIAADRVTVAAALPAIRNVNPGATSEVVYELVLSNSYATMRTLTRLRIDNVSVGAGNAGQLDADFELLRLRLDGDGDGMLGSLQADPVLATGFFTNQSVTFMDLSAVIEADSSIGVFLEIRIALGAADEDRLRVAISGPAGLDFVESTSVSGIWPVTGPVLRVDGMVAAQIASGNFLSPTLGAAEGPALALDLRIPANGYQDDTLQEIVVENAGSAAEKDLGELRLWRDGGDEAFNAGSGDDMDLGLFTPILDRWQSLPLDEALVGGVGGRFFVSALVSASPTDSSTVQLRVPVDGIEVQSGNDGPIDQAVLAPGTRLLSSSSLLASMEFTAPASVVGDSVGLRMILRNVGSEDVVSIGADSLVAGGNGLALIGSGPWPATTDLAPGETDTLRWVLAADQPGLVTFAGFASGTGTVSGLERRALPASSAPHEIHLAATEVGVVAQAASPTTVTQGQVGVVPLSFTFDHPVGDEVADVEIHALRLRFESASFQGVDVQDLLAGVRISEGTIQYAATTVFAAGDSIVDLVLSPPAVVTNNEPVTLAVQLDVEQNASVPSFHATLQDSTGLMARDAISGAAIPVELHAGSYPIRSGLMTVRSEFSQLDLSMATADTTYVAEGSAGLSLLEFEAYNPGLAGPSAEIDIERLVVDLLDSLGAGVASAADYLDRIEVRVDGVASGAADVTASTDSTITIDFSPKARIAVSNPVAISLLGDLAPSTGATAFRVRVRSGTVLARDVATQDTVPVIATPDPLLGGPVIVQEVASDYAVDRLSGLGPTTIIGEQGVVALRFTLGHPGSMSTGTLRVDSVSVAMRDETGSPADLRDALDRLAFVQDGTEILAVADFSGAGSRLDLALPSVALAPGTTTELTLVIDTDAGAPDSSIELWIPTLSLVVVDANSGAPATPVPLNGSALPLSSGVSRLSPPARELVVDLVSTAPAVIAPAQAQVAFADLSFANPADEGATNINVESLTFVVHTADGNPVEAWRALARVELAESGGTLASAEFAALDSSRVRLDFNPALSVTPAALRKLELRADLAADFLVPGIFFELKDADVRVDQPASALLGIDVVAAAGRSFPFRTETSSVAARNLTDSFSNFPNPFAAGREPTRFAYYLPRDGRVTLTIYTLLGDRVVTLVDDEARSPGLYQDDLWDGANGRGDTVRNGVYLARIAVAYSDGSDDEELRKVAVRR